jgi:hypothetical protein
MFGCATSPKQNYLSDIKSIDIHEPLSTKVIWVDDKGDEFYYERYKKEWHKLDNSYSPKRKISQRNGQQSTQRNTVDPKKFNAKGDGVTDDTAAIQKAINYCKNNEGVVFLPKGEYLVKELEINVSMIGEPGTILKLMPKANSFLGNVSGKEIIISGITFDGNATHQEKLPFTQNYYGYGSRSLLQSFYLFENLSIENCRFINSIQGAIAFSPLTRPEVKDIYSRHLRPNSKNYRVNSLSVVNSNFEHLTTEAIRFTPHQEDDMTNSTSIVFPSEFLVDSCNFIQVGSITTEKEYGNTSHGNVILTGFINLVEVINSTFYNSARFDIKVGLANNVISFNNKSYNACWGHLQTQSQYIKNTEFDFPSTIEVEKCKFISNREDGTSFFVQLNGSSDENLKHRAYERVSIIDNTILYLNEYNKTFSDCIKVTESGNYLNILIQKNYCYGLQRGFIEVSRARNNRLKTIENLSVKENVVIGKSKLGTVANSIVYLQGVDPNNIQIKNFLIDNNTANHVQAGIIIKNTLIGNLEIINNSIEGENENIIRYEGEGGFKGISKIRNNYLSGNIIGFDISLDDKNYKTKTNRD